MQPPSLLDYYEQRFCSRQWLGFLAALSNEFENALPEEDLRLLMRRVGKQFADAHALPSCETLDSIETAINAEWQQIDWGYASFTEQANQLLITHQASPLKPAFGPKSHWANGFFEGAYQAWFVHCGMPEGLKIRQAAGVDDTQEDRAVSFLMTRTE